MSNDPRNEGNSIAAQRLQQQGRPKPSEELNVRMPDKMANSTPQEGDDVINADLRELPLMLQTALQERDTANTRLTHLKARLALAGQSLDFCKQVIKKFLNVDLDVESDYLDLVKKLENMIQQDEKIDTEMTAFTDTPEVRPE